MMWIRGEIVSHSLHHAFSTGMESILGMFPEGNIAANIAPIPTLSDRSWDEDAGDVNGCLRDCSCSIDSSYVANLLDGPYLLHRRQVCLMERLLPAELGESSHE